MWETNAAPTDIQASLEPVIVGYAGLGGAPLERRPGKASPKDSEPSTEKENKPEHRQAGYQTELGQSDRGPGRVQGHWPPRPFHGRRKGRRFAPGRDPKYAAKISVTSGEAN